MALPDYKQFRFPEGGGELTLAAMNEYQRMEIGRKTYRFCKSVMRDPVLRARVKARAAEIRAENERREREGYESI